mmetsp:Transcript_46361/g.119646  ORF Transcript_46361/g.119646 Transcript_46361/m.119646 type:complete len:243 (-) Transcript_46361:109-837(-)
MSRVQRGANRLCPDIGEVLRCGGAQPELADVSVPVFVTPHLDEAETVVVIIQGSGKVRAGMWARSLCINNSMTEGSQIPYVQRCVEKGWGVAVLNPNENMKKGKIIHGSASPQEHLLYFYDHVLARIPKLRRVGIVAHSFGGVAAVDLLCTRPDCVERVRAMALTDSVHKHVPEDEAAANTLRERCVNFVSSSLPLGSPVSVSAAWQARTLCPRVSAGHRLHEWTSHASIDLVFDHLEQHLR